MKKPTKVSYATSLWQGLEDLVGVPKTAQELAHLYTKTERYCDDMAKSLVQSSADANKRIAKNAAQSIDDIIAQMDQSTSKNLDKVNHQIDDFQKQIDKTNKKIQSGQHIQAHGFEKVGPKSVAKEIFKKGKEFEIEEFVGALRDLSGHVGRLVPQLAVLVSVGAILKEIIDSVFELDSASTQLSMTFGGNKKAALELIDNFHEVIKATNLSKEQVLSLGNAFQQTGIPLMGNTEHLLEYMTVAGNINKVIGTGDDTIARYTRTLKQSGYTAKDVFSTYDDMYQAMQKYQLTIADLNAAMNEGDQLWSQFGALSGKTLDKLQRDILDTKGMFKAFNVDIKNTGSLLSGIWGDPQTQMKQAALMSAMLKMKGSAAYNELILNPKQGAQNLMQAAVKWMNSMPQLHMGKTDQELQTQFHDEQLTGIMLMRQKTMAMLTQQFRLPPEMLSQALSDFDSFRRQFPGKGIDDWTGKRLLQHTLPGQPGSLGAAGKTLDTSVEGTALKMNNLLKEIAEDFAVLIVDQLPPLLDSVSTIADLIRQADIGGAAKKAGKVFEPGLKNLTRKDFLNPLTWANPIGGLSPAPMTLRGGVSKGDALPSPLPKPHKSISFIDSKDLNNYRKAQGLGIRGLHKDFMSNAAQVLRAAKQLGADPAAMIATMIQESGGNAKAAGDGGHSIGLFQLNDWGKGRGFSLQQKQDPLNNALIAGKEFAILKEHHPTWSAGHIAAAAQRPQEFIDAKKAGHNIEGTSYAHSVNAMLPFAEKVIKILESQEKRLNAIADQATESNEASKKRYEEMRLKSMTQNKEADMRQHYLKHSIG